MDEIRDMAGEKFEYLGKDRFHLDLLLGTDEYRLRKKTPSQLVEENRPKVEAFSKMAAKYRLYE